MINTIEERADRTRTFKAMMGSRMKVK
jgi:hypothetical protein